MPSVPDHEPMPDPSKLVDKAMDDVDARIAKGRYIAGILSNIDSPVDPDRFNNPGKGIQPPIHSQIKEGSNKQLPDDQA